MRAISRMHARVSHQHTGRVRKLSFVVGLYEGQWESMQVISIPWKTLQKLITKKNRVLVKANACLGTENGDRVTIFNYQVPSKQLLTRLLDQLAQSAPWAQTDSCQECGKGIKLKFPIVFTKLTGNNIIFLGFSLTQRTHHCRHCGRALCSKCSDQEVPIIKFGENKPVRVCQVCFNVLKTGSCWIFLFNLSVSIRLQL